MNPLCRLVDLLNASDPELRPLLSTSEQQWIDRKNHQRRAQLRAAFTAMAKLEARLAMLETERRRVLRKMAKQRRRIKGIADAGFIVPKRLAE